MGQTPTRSLQLSVYLELQPPKLPCVCTRQKSSLAEYGKGFKSCGKAGKRISGATNNSLFNTRLSLISAPRSALEGEGILIRICLLTMMLWTDPLFLVSIFQVSAYKFRNKSRFLKCPFRCFLLKSAHREIGLSYSGIKSIFLLWSSDRLKMSLQVLTTSK